MTTEELEALARRLADWTGFRLSVDESAQHAIKILQALKDVRRETREEDLAIIISTGEDLGYVQGSAFSDAIRQKLDSEK